MSWLTRWTAAAIGSAVVAGLLVYLPLIDRTSKSSDIPTFQQTRQLTEQNLVDRLTRLPLMLDIRRADWNATVLEVDLLAYSRPEQDTVYHDLYELEKLGLAETANVSQVLVRVLQATPGSLRNGQLLVAMDARKEDKKGTLRTPEGSGEIQRYLQTRHRMTYTQKWLDPASDKSR